MKLRGVEVRRVAMPLRTPFRSATGVEHERDIVLVRVETDGGHEGWGECGALTTPHYTAEYAAGAAAVIERFLAPALLDVPALDAAAVGSALAWCSGHPMAKAAVEMAVLDAELRAEGRSLADHLGATRRHVPAGVAIGETDDLVATVADYVEAGYRRVKLKIEPGNDVEPVRAVRDRFGPHLLLQVDANGSYTLHDAPRLEALDEFDLVCLEQPLAPDALCDSATLARRLRTPICLDETLTSARVTRDALALGACSVVNIKVARVGGLLEARRVHDVCVEGGVPAWCGGMLETGLGRAANIALAALPGFTLPGDLSASDRYWAEDLTPPFVLDDGAIAVPTGPGLGVEPRADVLAAVTTATTWIRP